MQGVAESLAGRVAVMHLQGLSVAEAEGRGGVQTPFLPRPADPQPVTPTEDLMAVFSRIWRGSFPALIAQPQLDRDLFYSSYVQTYLQRDVRELTQVTDLPSFNRFLRTAAARTGQMLNMADMARDVGVAPNTCKAWLSVLEASGLVYLLEPWHSNLSKRLTKTPKLYFLDTGLATYLTQWSNPATLEAGAMSGAIFETWVMAELLKSYWHNGKRAPFFYYRDKDQKEIDLLIEQDGMLYPVEIKKSASPTRDATRHFEVLPRLGMSIGHGALVCLVNQALPINPTVTILPCVF
jgi:predicted AAA+ superfamily ATPase